MSKKYFWNKENNSNEPADSNPNTNTEYDPRVRAFIKSFKPSLNQLDANAEKLRITELRKFFNAYVASQSGFDPLVKILNQLEREGFSLEVDELSNEFVLPCVRIRTLKTLPAHEC